MEITPAVRNTSSAMTDQLTDAIGYVGGITVAVCTLPQIWHMYSTQSAADLQKRFLFLYLTGSILTFIYLIVMGAWAAWVTMTLEVSIKVVSMEHFCIHGISLGNIFSSSKELFCITDRARTCHALLQDLLGLQETREPRESGRVDRVCHHRGSKSHRVRLPGLCIFRQCAQLQDAHDQGPSRRLARRPMSWQPISRCPHTSRL